MKPLPPPSQKASALLAYLSSHVGRQNGISAAALANSFNWPERKVRDLVTELRLHGAGVVGTPDTGYFMATTVEELDEGLELMRKRCMRGLLLIRRQRQTIREILAGQKRLPT